MQRGGQVMDTIRHPRRPRLRTSRVGVLALALAVGGACSDDDGTDDANAASETTDASSEGSESDVTNGVDTDASTGTVSSTAPVAGGTTAPSTPNATDPDCVDDDVEVVDADEGTVAVEPGAPFERTWVIENAGECTWTSQYAWTFTGGDALTIESVTPIAEVAPGESIEITVTLQAPAEPGRYAGQFQLVAPSTMEPLGEAAPYMVEVTR